MTLPSNGAQASTVHRPSTARPGRSIGSQRLCRTLPRFSRFKNSLTWAATGCWKVPVFGDADSHLAGRYDSRCGSIPTGANGFAVDRDLGAFDRLRCCRDFHTNRCLRFLSERRRRDDNWKKPRALAPHAGAPASSARACVMTTAAPWRARAAITAATSTSGQAEPVRTTPIADATTAQLPIRSLREHSHADRILLSPDRYVRSNTKQRALAARAANPTTPMVVASGGAPANPFQTDEASTHTPNSPMVSPLPNAAIARLRITIPATKRLMP